MNSSQQICLHFHTKLRMKWAFDLIERCLSLNGLPCHIPEQHEAMCRYDYHGLDKRLYIKAQNNWNGVLERVLLSIANNTIETGKKMIMEHMHVHMFRKPLELPQTHTHFAASNRNNLHHTTYFLFSRCHSFMCHLTILWAKIAMQTNSLDVWTTMYDDSSMISYAKMVGEWGKNLFPKGILSHSEQKPIHRMTLKNCSSSISMKTNDLIFKHKVSSISFEKKIGQGCDFNIP